MAGAKAVARVKQLIQFPVQRTIEERAPLIILKNGHRVMVELSGRAGWQFELSRDFGLTCKPFATCLDYEGVVDALLSLAEVE